MEKYGIHYDELKEVLEDYRDRRNQNFGPAPKK
jgi:hypothetical protein